MTRRKTLKIAVCYAPDGFVGVNEPFWLLRPIHKNVASPGNGVTVAFDASSRGAVDAFHAAALAAGGSDESAPGLRLHYHSNYYGAYVRDLDGNKICALCHAAVSA